MDPKQATPDRLRSQNWSGDLQQLRTACSTTQDLQLPEQLLHPQDCWRREFLPAAQCWPDQVIQKRYRHEYSASSELPTAKRSKDSGGLVHQKLESTIQFLSETAF